MHRKRCFALFGVGTIIIRASEPFIKPPVRAPISALVLAGLDAKDVPMRGFEVCTCFAFGPMENQFRPVLSPVPGLAMQMSIIPFQFVYVGVSALDASRDRKSWKKGRSKVRKECSKERQETNWCRALPDQETKNVRAEVVRGTFYHHSDRPMRVGRVMFLSA